MTPDRLRRAEEIFFEALALEGEARTRAMAAACAGDPELRIEVESLLEHSRREGFLESPALGADFSVLPAAATAERDDMAGQTVGRYRVRQRLASGGMGTVYRAERDDPNVGGTVAIKIVKRGMDSEEILRRFRQERKTLAALEHPNIARLLDGGATHDGRPYLVMEFVRGVPINRYGAAHPLSIHDKLRLFLKVCDGVGWAHQSLIVHRDLKPANILVDERGEPKLLDFGIAKVLTGSGTADVTSEHERRLTPEYASPEQIRGEPVTTASDVYSLGVILYELLTGARPYTFETRSAPEIERVVTTEEPALPSVAVLRRPTGPVAPEGPAREPPERMSRRLRGDLDTIVLTAMRKDASRRYPSVERLAGDIRLFLSGQPITARKDTFAYRAAKFAARNRVTVVLGSAIVLALVVGTVTVAYQARVAARQRDAAFLARDQSEALAKFLQDMLGAADPNNKGPNVTVKDMLDEAALRLNSEIRDQPLVRAAVRSTIGVTYANLGVLDRAEQELNAAYQERLALLGPGHHDVAESKSDLAILRYNQERYDEAERLLREALATFLTIRGDHNPDIAKTKSSLGAVLRAEGKLADAEATLRDALDIQRRIGGGESLDAAQTLNNLANVLRECRDLAGAEEMLTESLRIREKSLGPSHPLVAQSVDNLAVIVHQKGDLPKAEGLYRRALDLASRTLDPSSPDMAVTLSNLASLLVQSKRPEEALPLLQRCLEIRRAVFGAGDARTLFTRVRVAEALLVLKRTDEAVEMLSPALDGALRGTMDARVRASILAFGASFYDATGNAARAAELRAALGNVQRE